MGADQNRRGAGDVTFGQGDVFGARCLVSENAKVPFAAKSRCHGFLRRLAHQIVVAVTIGNQFRDGADFQAVFLGKRNQVRQTRHGSVVVHDLADHAGGVQACEAGNVGRGLGMACAYQHAAGAGF